MCNGVTLLIFRSDKGKKNFCAPGIVITLKKWMSEEKLST